MILAETITPREEISRAGHKLSPRPDNCPRKDRHNAGSLLRFLTVGLLHHARPYNSGRIKPSCKKKDQQSRHLSRRGKPAFHLGCELLLRLLLPALRESWAAPRRYAGLIRYPGLSSR